MKLSFAFPFVKKELPTDSYTSSVQPSRNPLTLFITKITTQKKQQVVGYNEEAQNRSQFSFNPRKFKKYLKNSYLLPFLLVFIIVGLVVYISYQNINKSTQATLLDNDGRVDIQKPKATYKIDKNFAFPLRNQAGKEVSKISYHIENAELRDEIIVKGQRATAVKGRTFLIINLKISNDFNAPVQINARDYIRLIINDSKEKLAPDIHNDPVEVQAISTKPTRIGFPINDIDKNIKLQIGEISGEKETIIVTFK